MNVEIHYKPLIKSIKEAVEEYNSVDVQVTEAQFVELALGQLLLGPDLQPHRHLLDRNPRQRKKVFKFPWFESKEIS